MAKVISSNDRVRVLVFVLLHMHPDNSYSAEDIASELPNITTKLLQTKLKSWFTKGFLYRYKTKRGEDKGVFFYYLAPRGQQYIKKLPKLKYNNVKLDILQYQDRDSIAQLTPKHVAWRPSRLGYWVIIPGDKDSAQFFTYKPRGVKEVFEPPEGLFGNIYKR